MIVRCRPAPPPPPPAFPLFLTCGCPAGISIRDTHSPWPQHMGGTLGTLYGAMVPFSFFLSVFLPFYFSVSHFLWTISWFLCLYVSPPFTLPFILYFFFSFYIFFHSIFLYVFLSFIHLFYLTFLLFYIFFYSIILLSVHSFICSIFLSFFYLSFVHLSFFPLLSLFPMLWFGPRFHDCLAPLIFAWWMQKQGGGASCRVGVAAKHLVRAAQLWASAFCWNRAQHVY